MENLLRNIILYLEYLNNDCELCVSVHFDECMIKCIPRNIFSAFLPYNCHKNPYCVMVKKEGYSKCLRNQKTIIENFQNQEPIINVCHAGVCEVIYPIFKDGVKGYVTVSGYKPENYTKYNVTNYELWGSVLEESIPLKLINCVIPPLVLMIENLINRYSNKEDNEYSAILNFLNEYHTNITLSDLSKHFKCSKSHISHLFKKESGISLRAYCNNLKLEDAKKLLQTTGLSVTEIALDAGFSDTSYFIYLFKNRYGVTPFKFRQNKNLRN